MRFLQDFSKTVRVILLDICWRFELVYRYLFDPNELLPLLPDKHESQKNRPPRLQVMLNSSIILTHKNSLRVRRATTPDAAASRMTMRCICASPLSFKGRRRSRSSADSDKSESYRCLPSRTALTDLWMES